jgi:hypothetical protein
MPKEDTQFKKGEAKGRPKGAVGAFTKTVKDTVLEAFQEAQKDPKTSIMGFLQKYPRDFYQIAAKLIPLDVKAEIKVPEGIQIIFGSAPGCDPLPDDTDTNPVHPGL